MGKTNVNSKKIIVIGTSAGGVQALVRIVGMLPADLPCPICVVIHLPMNRPSSLAKVLNRAGSLKAKIAEDGDVLESGHLYVAPPNQHLEIADGGLRVARGPSENLFRPSIDTLFRSAASNFDGLTIGVILSGALSDGVNGLAAIKENGGIAIVQKPSDAIFGGMPSRAIDKVDVDHILPSIEIAGCLMRLCSMNNGDAESLKKAQLSKTKSTTQ